HESYAVAHVGADGHRVAGARVRQCERVAACGGELDEPRREEVRARDDLHVPKLADVVVLAAERSPADEDVGRALAAPLAVDYPGPVVVVPAGSGVRLVHGRAGLLDLEEQRVVTAAALQ